MKDSTEASLSGIQSLPPQVRKHLTNMVEEGIYKSEESAYYEIKRVVRLLANDKKKAKK
jgi:Arc/MetJ-type ribon-helix-helix transcriptional regulator